MLELRQLRYFLEVCQAGSIAEAARGLHMAQPALSRQISALEQQLGEALFVRMPRGVSLTRSGEALQGLARELLSQSAGLAEKMRLASGGLSGNLRLGVMPGYAAAGRLAQAVARLMAVAPQATVAIETMRSAEMLEQLRQRKLDLALMAWRSPFDASFAGVAVQEEEMGVVMPAHWPQARQRQGLNLADLAQETMILFARARSPVHYDHVVQACLAAGFDPRRGRLRAADIQAMTGLVASGLGYAIVPLSMAQQWGPAVTFRPAAGLNIRFSLELVHLAEAPDPLVELFLRLCTASEAKQV